MLTAWLSLLVRFSFYSIVFVVEQFLPVPIDYYQWLHKRFDLSDVDLDDDTLRKLYEFFSLARFHRRSLCLMISFWHVLVPRLIPNCIDDDMETEFEDVELFFRQRSSDEIRPRKHLVLDLDETLVYTTTDTLLQRAKPWMVLEVGAGGQHPTLYHVYKRPFVDEFIKNVTRWFTIHIYTASMRDYADPVISALFPKEYGQCIPTRRRYFREHCLVHGPHKKQLKILDGSPHRSQVVWIDDLPSAYADHLNGIVIPAWRCDNDNDCVLLELTHLLDSLRRFKDVRRGIKTARRESSSSIERR